MFLVALVACLVVSVLTLRTSHLVVDIELVFAGYCNDSYASLKAIDCTTQRAFVYNKCKNWQAPSGFPSCVNFLHLPNVGRESQTYFHHLATHYERLRTANGLLAFFQGAVEKDAFSIFEQHVASWQEEGLGFVPLAVTACAMQFGCPNQTILSNLMSFYFPNKHISMWISGFRGQFLVSMQRAVRVPRWLFEYNEALLLSEGGSDAVIGHSSERLWNVLFGCSIDASINTAAPVCLDDLGSPNTHIPFEGLPAPISSDSFISMMTGPASQLIPGCPNSQVTDLSDLVSHSKILNSSFSGRFQGLGSLIEKVSKKPSLHH
jgi:hypothetical protein